MIYNLFVWVVSFRKIPRFFIAYAIIFVIAFCAQLCIMCAFIPLGCSFDTALASAIGAGVGCGTINAISLVSID